ncbi:MAG: GDP-fucose synthetase [Gammaproteobacteria bacterium RIFCSPHIGHO2_02_FULL_39_13]|nr:MAG: GDP-fucose synthetase [Gammaproteobacteria bacterium RIFCSPHIGHO2_02_FULL_39_13]OGT48962.1 MAG: GDP-fucose synthetase [Gammaproteobacteria bacterium RIFCSPHIGHO2_12_FULL_39_24]
MDREASVLILGATGLIGSACLRYLKELGFSRLHYPTRAELNLLNTSAVSQYVEKIKPQFVILAAGMVGGIFYNKTKPADFINTNLAIQLNVFQAAQKAEVNKLIFFGSSCMYPRECVQPMSEDLLLTGKPEATSMSYAMSKLAGVQLCHAYNQQYQTQRFIALIPNSAYGPFDNFDPNAGHVMSAMMAKMHDAKEKNLSKLILWGTGTPRREFVHADDIARAVIHVLSCDETSAPLNVGVGMDWSIRELATMIAETVGFGGEIVWDTSKPDGVLQKLLDSKKITELGWKPTIAIRDGIKKTYEWFFSEKRVIEKN